MRTEKMNKPKHYVLSVWQPWATLLARHVKAIETRAYAWRGGMPIAFAIHAAKKKHSFLKDFCDRFRERGFLSEQYEDLPFGAVIGCGVLSDCVETSRLQKEGRVSPIEDALGDFSAGRFGWMFSKMEEIEPIPMVGQQGPWPWDHVGKFEVPDWFASFTGGG